MQDLSAIMSRLVAATTPVTAVSRVSQSKYNIIYADPPWHYNQRCTWSEQTGQATRFGGGASDAYMLMTDKQLIQLGPQVQQLAADDCFLLMWATCPRLPLALRVMEAWGFTYKTNAFSWIKITKDGEAAVGPGYYTGSNPEWCLLGTRGTPGKVKQGGKNLVRSVVWAPDQPLDPNDNWYRAVKWAPDDFRWVEPEEADMVVTEPRREHSRKPDSVRDKIVEAFGNKPRVELFSRFPWPGWDCYGNEIDGRDIRDVLPLPPYTNDELDVGSQFLLTEAMCQYVKLCEAGLDPYRILATL